MYQIDNTKKKINVPNKAKIFSKNNKNFDSGRLMSSIIKIKLLILSRHCLGQQIGMSSENKAEFGLGGSVILTLIDKLQNQ